MASRTVGMRVDNDNFTSIKSFFSKDRKQIIKSQEFMENDDFFLLPMAIYKKAIDLIPESRLGIIVEDMIKLHNPWTEVPQIIDELKAWCIYCNAKQHDKLFSCTTSEVNENIEVTWVHHFGVKNNNYSNIMYQALSGNPNYSKDYNVIAGDIGVHSLTLTFEKI